MRRFGRAILALLQRVLWMMEDARLPWEPEESWLAWKAVQAKRREAEQDKPNDTIPNPAFRGEQDGGRIAGHRAVNPPTLRSWDNEGTDPEIRWN